MAILALMLWPDCGKELLSDCVTHDLGEYVTGDIPWGAPNKDNEHEADALSDMGMLFASVDKRLKFLDQLDAYLWMMHHAPHLARREDWQDQHEKILATSDELGVCLIDHGIKI